MMDKNVCVEKVPKNGGGVGLVDVRELRYSVIIGTNIFILGSQSAI